MYLITTVDSNLLGLIVKLTEPNYFFTLLHSFIYKFSTDTMRDNDKCYTLPNELYGMLSNMEMEIISISPGVT